MDLSGIGQPSSGYYNQVGACKNGQVDDATKHCKPPANSPSTETVVLTLRASGNVDDYDPRELEGKIATAAGVHASVVSVTSSVTETTQAASVLITATIAVPAATTAAAVRTSLSSKLC